VKARSSEARLLSLTVINIADDGIYSH